MQRITFQASQVELSEVQSNDIYMSVLMRMFSTRPNRNGYAVSEAFIDNIIANAAKYTCLPQCADANRLRLGVDKGLTHMLDPLSGEFESEQIGSFFSFAKATDEFGMSLIGEARIPKRNQVLCETLLKMYERRELNFSFEILVNAMEERNGVWVIDAAEGNELIGMAVVTTPAYPEATAQQLVAERQNREDDTDMDESQKKIAELEAKLMLAEQKSENDEEMRKKDEELEQAQADKAKAEADKTKAEADLAAAQNTISEKDTTIAEKDTAIAERDAAIVVKDARIAELEAQVAELTPFKSQAEALEAEKAAAELTAKQTELMHFAEAQGLDPKAEAVAAAIQNVDYAALIAEVNKNGKPGVKPMVASYAMGGIAAKGEYDDLLEKA